MGTLMKRLGGAFTGKTEQEMIHGGEGKLAKEGRLTSISWDSVKGSTHHLPAGTFRRGEGGALGKGAGRRLEQIEGDIALMRSERAAQTTFGKGVKASETKFLSTWGGRALTIFVGYQMLVGANVQDPEECKETCINRKNSDPSWEFPPPPPPEEYDGTAIPEGHKGARCPAEWVPKKCKKYCATDGDGACSRQNCITRAAAYVRDKPLGALATTMQGAFQDTTSFWATWKNFIYGFIFLVGIFLFYKFSVAWVGGKADYMVAKGKYKATRGMREFEGA